MCCLICTCLPHLPLPQQGQEFFLSHSSWLHKEGPAFPGAHHPKAISPQPPPASAHCEPLTPGKGFPVHFQALEPVSAIGEDLESSSGCAWSFQAEMSVTITAAPDGPCCCTGWWCSPPLSEIRCGSLCVCVWATSLRSAACRTAALLLINNQDIAIVRRRTEWFVN